MTTPNRIRCAAAAVGRWLEADGNLGKAIARMDIVVLATVIPFAVVVAVCWVMAPVLLMVVTGVATACVVWWAVR